MKTIFKCGFNVLVVMLLLGTASTTALASNTYSTDPTEQHDDWVLVQQESGINVYFSKFSSNGDTFLKVKIENSTYENMNFTWNLLNNGSPVIVTEDSMQEVYTQLASAESRTYGTAFTITLNTEDTLEQFSIRFNSFSYSTFVIKKRKPSSPIWV